MREAGFPASKTVSCVSANVDVRHCRDHCPSRVDTATGQRIGRFSDLQVHPTLLEFAVHPPPSVEGSSQGPTLWLRWEAEQESRFPLQWLRQNCYVDFHSEEARKSKELIFPS